LCCLNLKRGIMYLKQYIFTFFCLILQKLLTRQPMKHLIEINKNKGNYKSNVNKYGCHNILAYGSYS